MCQFKSGLALRDKVYVPDHNSHADMLEALGIKDDYMGASKTFVRFELLPPDGDMCRPVPEWCLRVDQDITPDWWDADNDRARIVEAVSSWAKEHIIVDGTREVSDGIYYAWGNSQVTAWENSKVTAWDNSLVIWPGKHLIQAPKGYTLEVRP